MDEGKKKNKEKVTRARRVELTPEIQSSICAFIRAGGFPHVAAEAAGVPREEFDRWMKVGSPVDRPNGWNPNQYTPFWHAVTQAKAQARLTAEMQALKENPVDWLKHGPGKDRPNDPGWGQMPKAVIHQHDHRQVNVLLSPEMQGLFSTILQILGPYPEARAAVAQALAQADQPAKAARKIIEALPNPPSLPDSLR